mgnify:CR=1 FL=1
MPLYTSYGQSFLSQSISSLITNHQEDIRFIEDNKMTYYQLRKKSGGFFGSGESTGSVGVVTINLPRIAYLAEDEKDFYRRLTKLMDVAARSLKIKRNVITKLLNEGLYPYTKRYLGTFNDPNQLAFYMFAALMIMFMILQRFGFCLRIWEKYHREILILQDNFEYKEHVAAYV